MNIPETQQLPIKDRLEGAIKAIVAKVTAGTTADEDLKYTQAAQNLAHTLHIMMELDRPKHTEVG